MMVNTVTNKHTKPLRGIFQASQLIRNSELWRIIDDIRPKFLGPSPKLHDRLKLVFGWGHGPLHSWWNLIWVFSNCRHYVTFSFCGRDEDGNCSSCGWVGIQVFYITVQELVAARSSNRSLTVSSSWKHTKTLRISFIMNSSHSSVTRFSLVD